MTEIFKWVLVSITYFLSTIKPKYGIGFVVFSLPLASRCMVFDNILISLPVFMVIALFAGLLIRVTDHKCGSRGRVIKLVNRDVMILFLLSLIISLTAYLPRGLPSQVALLTNEMSNLLNYMAVMVSALILYAIVIKHTYSGRDWFFFTRIFLSGLLFLAAMYVLSGPLHMHLPTFLQPISVIGDVNNIHGVPENLYSQARFAGYVGFYENFVEYLVIVIAFAVILIVKRRTQVDLLLGAGVIVASLWFGLLSGTRAFPILLVILFMLVLILQMRSGSSKQIVVAGILSIVTLVIVYLGLTFYSDSLLVTRFSAMDIHDSVDVFSLLTTEPGKNFFALINRPDTLVYFQPIIKTAGLFGVGPLTIYSLSGSIIVFHNSYYGIYVSLGVLGLASFILLIVKLLSGLHQAFKNSPSEILYAIFFALIITLMVDGIKVSFWRIAPTVYIYWFLFAMIASLTRLWRTGEWNS